MRINLFKLIFVSFAGIILGSLIAIKGFIGFLVLFGGIVFLIFSWFIFKEPSLGLILMAFFLPFERIGGYRGLGINIRISQIIFLITLLAWLLKNILIKKEKIKWPFPNTLFSLFLGVNFLSLINSGDLKRSTLVFSFLLFSFALYFLIINLIKKEVLSKILSSIFLSASFVSLFGFFQFFGDILGLPDSITFLLPRYSKEVLGFPRVQSTALEPLYFANYLLIPLTLALVLLLSKNLKFKYSFLFSTVFLTLSSLILTFSKGGIIAFLIITIFLLFFYFRSFFTRKNFYFICLICCLIFLTLIVFASTAGIFSNFEKIYSRTIKIITGATLIERAKAYEIAFEGFFQSPLIGIGLGTFGPYFTSWGPIPEKGWPIVNNEYLEILCETGILGLILFLSFIGSVLIRSFLAFKICKEEFLKTVLLGLTLAFIGILVQYFTFSTLYIFHIWFLIGLLVGIQEKILA